MKFAETNLRALFDVIISLQKNEPFTMVLEKPNTGVFSIYKATHEQAAVSKHGALLMQGTTLEIQRYLQGMRDYIIEYKECVNLNF